MHETHLVRIDQNVARAHVRFLHFLIRHTVWANNPVVALHEAQISIDTVAWHQYYFEALCVFIEFAAVQLKLKILFLINTKKAALRVLLDGFKDIFLVAFDRIKLIKVLIRAHVRSQLSMRRNSILRRVESEQPFYVLVVSFTLPWYHVVFE